MLSILAGIFIGLGCIVNLAVGGGVLGAFLFSIGLIAVLRFEAYLFTGKAGLLATREIGGLKLLEIWIGNFLGTFAVALCCSFLPRFQEVISGAEAIVAIRAANGFVANFMLGVPCGILMYVAVKGFDVRQPFYAVLPVMVFILAGFNHCVADMGYCHIAGYGYETLLPTTLGNIIGCNVIPWIKSLPFQG